MPETTTQEVPPVGTAVQEADIVRVVEKHDGSRGALISILEDLQALYNYLPGEALRLVADRTGESLVDIYGVATFYRHFAMEPRGHHLVSVCMGTACHVRGAPQVLKSFEHEIGVGAGETTPDREYSLTTVNCLGACALGPVAVVDGEYQRGVRESEIPGIVHRCGCEAEERSYTGDERYFQVEVSCPRCNRSLMLPEHPILGLPSIHVTVSFQRKHGWLRLSSLYGSFQLEAEHELPADSVADFFCPRCHGQLRSTKLCPHCDAPMISLLVKGGGMIQFCSRRGCKEHLLDLSD